MSRHFFFQRHQPGARRLPGRCLSVPWLRPSAAPGAGSPRHQCAAHAHPTDSARDLGNTSRSATDQTKIAKNLMTLSIERRADAAAGEGEVASASCAWAMCDRRANAVRSQRCRRLPVAAAFSPGRPAQATPTAERKTLVLAILPCLSRDRESSFLYVQ
eukprot:6754703-Prymnesium_polylepis.1